MSRNVPVRAEPYALKNKLRRIWRQFVRVMACIVVFCTTYAMILPAITMQRDTICGISEHTHGMLCYVQLTSKTVQELTCTYESLGVHVHTAECQDELGQTVCGYADYLVHTHDDRCGDTCMLPQISEHTHSDDCYNTHAHDEACYTAVPGALLCQIHVHGDGCYDPGEPICGLTEDAHVHGVACYAPTLTCAAAEHTHADGCYDNGDPVCGVTEEGHVHEDICYAPTLTCGEAEHTHADGCYDNGEPICGQTEDVHVHGDACYAPTLLCGEGDHTHGDGCYEEELVLSCGLEAISPEDATLTCGKEEVILHSHGEDCYDAETGELSCGLTVIESHSHTGPCFTATEIPLDDMETLTCTETDENHLHIERCYGTWAMICGTEEHTHVESCYPAEPEYDCGLTEHTHDDSCYDAEGALQCTLEPHSHAESGCGIVVDPDVAYVNDLIANIPCAEEIEAKLAEFQAAGDDEGAEAWQEEIYRDVAEAYYYYDQLSDTQRAALTDEGKLLELEYIWSVTTYRADYSTTIHWVDYYSYEEGLTVGKETSAVVFVDEPVDSFGYYYWTGFVIEREGSHFRVKEVLPYETKKTGRTPSTTGYIVMVFSNVMSRAAVGDYVAFKGFYPDHNHGLSVSGYGTVTFSESKMVSSQAPEVENYTSTSAFVNLNLYDYHGDINANGYTDINTRFLAGNTAYPGFQWNGGAYPYRYRKDEGVAVPNPERDWIASRYYVDCLDFGNSYITDYGLDDYFTSTFDSAADSTWYRGYKTDGSVSVAKADPGDNLINGIIFRKIDGVQSNADHPIGVSTDYEAIGKMLAYDVNGYYPKLGYTAASHGESLRYLFDAAHPGHFAEKKNTQNIDGLFQKNEVTGEYYYDSRENHAQFDTATSKFVLYKQVITPNYILYPFGNFMPLNDITDPGGATQVSAFDYQGGVKSYFESVMGEIQNKANLTSSEIQLYRMLLSYRYNWENWANPKRTNGRLWPTITAADTLNDYFDNSSEFGNDGVDFYRTDLQNLLTRVYNIDYNIPKNFFFGMDMSMNFMQPKDGLTGNDTNKDGTPDYPMVFYFAGDDDVWAFIDNILFLDLTGIHRHVGGKIDFVNGRVYYYAMDSYVNGAVEDEPYYSMTFAQILTQHGGIAEADLGKYLKKDSSGNYTTFLDYSTHQFNFYYMERGSGSSVCSIRFNFPLMKQNSISVTKENTALEGGQLGSNVLGNPDYYFDIMQGDNLFVGPNSVTGVSQYKIRNSDGSFVKDVNGEDKLYNTDDYGIFTLKAGQTAVFENIDENEGLFYVQELIRDEDNALYPTVSINDKDIIRTTRYNKLVDWQYRKYFSKMETTDPDNPMHVGPYGSKWYARSGYNTDSSSSSSFYFEQQNHVDTDKLAKLSITKVLDVEKPGTAANQVFKMIVKLDGIPLPVGTAYTVDGEQKTVAAAGVIELKGGQMATISNILSGTKFEVSEDLSFARDFFVSYKRTDGGEATVSGNTISGVIRHSSTAALTVTNTDNAAGVTLDGVKSIANAGAAQGENIFSFVLTEVDENGNALADGYTDTKTVTVTNGADTGFRFDLYYRAADYADGTVFPATHIYRIQESGGDGFVSDGRCYLAQITVGKGADGKLTAELASLALNGVDADSMAFVNTLLGDLTLKKIVDGGALSQQSGSFDFTVQFGTDATTPLTGWDIRVVKNGGVVGTFTTDSKGIITLPGIRHSDKVELKGIPLGTVWRITESGTDGYIVDWTVNGTSGSSNVAEGDIPPGGAEVVYTNHSTYALPETGGIPIPYTMVGWMLMILSGACLMYSKLKRRREAV